VKIVKGLTEQLLIDRYLGIPYKHRGRNLKGLDCWGLIIHIYKSIGIKVFDLESYEKKWSKKGKNYFVENYYSDWVPRKAPVFLDVILFRNQNNVVNHAGIYLSYSKVLQSTVKGVIITRFDDRINGKMDSIFRHIELTRGGDEDG